MPTLRHSVLAALSLTFVVIGCTRQDAEPSTDSIPVDTTLGADTSTAAVDLRGWTEDAGAALYIAEEDDDRATVVLPHLSDTMLADTAAAMQMAVELGAIAGDTVELFGRTGRIGTGVLGAADEVSTTDGESCTAWPSLSLSASAQASGASWTIALDAGRSVAIPLDSVDIQSGIDSARMTAEVSRLASILPNDTVAVFRGLPFAVRTIRRFSPVPGVSALVAEVVRKVNQEANPREERILIVAERDSGRTSGRYAVAYSERASGTEEDVETTDVLAALGLGPSRTPTLVLRREYFEGSAYALLERTGPKSWRVRWTSAYAGC
jgi:hypothetical protein